MVKNRLYKSVDGSFVLLEFNEARGQWEYYLLVYSGSGKPLYWTRAGNQEFQKHLCATNCVKHIGNNIKYPFWKSK